MAILFQKESAIALGMEAREYMIAPLNFDPGWTEVRAGVFVGGMDANNEDFNNGEEEQVVVNTPADYLTFGFKNSDTADNPGEAGSLFLGVRSQGAISEFSNYNIGAGRTVGFAADSIGKMNAVGYDGTTLVDGGEVISGSFSNGAIYFPEISLSQGYCGLYVIKLKIGDIGLATQFATISIAAESKIDGADYTPPALRNQLNNATFGPEISFDWNDSGIPRTIPDAFYIRIPYYRNRFMIASMRATNYL